jgi:hypothetical protein
MLCLVTKRCVHQQRGKIMKHFADPVTLFFIVRRFGRDLCNTLKSALRLRGGEL